MLILLLACTDVTTDTSDSAVVDDFCTSTADAGTSSLEEGTGTGTSGQVVGQFIQDVVVDPRDPQYVAFLDYLLDNQDVGGASSRGRTDAEGRFTATLGAGNWQVQTSGHQGSYYCAQETVFQVQAGKLTKLCINMDCN
jgi:hypothetical protein